MSGTGWKRPRAPRATSARRLHGIPQIAQMAGKQPVSPLRSRCVSDNLTWCRPGPWASDRPGERTSAFRAGWGPRSRTQVKITQSCCVRGDDHDVDAARRPAAPRPCPHGPAAAASTAARHETEAAGEEGAAALRLRALQPARRAPDPARRRPPVHGPLPLTPLAGDPPDTRGPAAGRRTASTR
jgi:hypothetical protein